MANLLHILEGWSKSMGLMDIKPEDKALSNDRLEKCAGCMYATESKVLKFIKGNADYIDTIYCGLCKCPCNEKSLVPEETCPAEFWNK